MTECEVYRPITGLQSNERLTSNTVSYRGIFFIIRAILSIGIAYIPAILLSSSRKAVAEAIQRKSYMNIARIFRRPSTRSTGNIEKEPSNICEVANHIQARPRKTIRETSDPSTRTFGANPATQSLASYKIFLSSLEK